MIILKTPHNNTVELSFGAKLRDLLKFPLPFQESGFVWDFGTNELQTKSFEKNVYIAKPITIWAESQTNVTHDNYIEGGKCEQMALIFLEGDFNVYFKNGS